MSKYFLIIIIIITAFSSCKVVNKAGKANLAYVYHNKNWYPQLELKAIKKSPLNYELIVSLNQEKLQISSTEYLTLDYQIQWFLSKGYYASSYIDSSLVCNFSDTIKTKTRSIIQKTIDLKLQQEGNFVVKLRISDENSGFYYDHFFDLFTSSKFKKENVIFHNSDEQLLFHHLGNINNEYSAEISGISLDEVIVDYFSGQAQFPLPPFSGRSVNDYETSSTDSTFILGVKNSLTKFSPDKAGLYIFKSHVSDKSRVSFFVGEYNFPQVENAAQMHPPLRYLTTATEYSEIGDSENIKLAIERFWLEIGRNPDRAKVLIGRYYKGVAGSNQWFTSDREGWKTDRGMIYTVFGPPNVVYKDAVNEHWIYGQEGHPYSIHFDFVKVEDAKSDNNYRLIRSPKYKDAWYKAVERWRK